MSGNNCFFLSYPDDKSEYSIIGNDALFKYLVQELPDHKNYAPERGDTGHWTAKGKFFFPLRLKKEDRINALLSVSPKNKKLSYSSNIRLHRTNQYRKSPGFPARPIDLRTIRERYGDHPVLAEVAPHTGAEWLIDDKNVAHLRFFTSPEIVDETQELMDMREDMDANCPEIDNQTTLAIAQFHESDDRICVLLSGPKAGAVAILSLDSDDAILFESFKEFIASLDADAVALLRKFGVADVVVDGKTVKPHKT